MEFTNDEILCYKALTNEYVNLDEIAQKSQINIDTIRRNIMLLQEKGFVFIDKRTFIKYKLGKFGRLYLNEKFPEELICEYIKDRILLSELKLKLGNKSGFVIGYAIKNRYVKMDNEYILPLNMPKEKDYETLRKLLNDYNKGRELSKEELFLLGKNNLLEKEEKLEYFVKKSNKIMEVSKNLTKTETFLTQEMLKSGEALKLKFKPYNVVADVEPINIGKAQPYLQFLNLIKNKLVSMGFEEMPTKTLTTEFYNFDVLFQPQNHPARTWTDTYSLRYPKYDILENIDLIAKIKKVHENGNEESKGWGYSWSVDIAKKLMPTAHGTAWSAHKMATNVENNKKYFAIARTYRPDVLDATHLNEFNQLEGFIISDDLSFRELLGLLKQFAIEIAGAKEVMFSTDYYPFTEPSVSFHVKHPDLGWVELGGAGIFRPEITKTLGINQRVIAWGLGIDRLAMFSLGIKDIRELYSQKLDWLRNRNLIDRV